MLNEKIKILDEVISKALCDLGNIPMLSDADYDEIIAKVGADINTIYTEDYYEDYTPEDNAEEYGYSSAEAMVADFPACALAHGGQKWENTNEVLEYDGITYEIWIGYYGDGQWEPIGWYGLVNPADKSIIVANSMQQNINNRYCPFFALATIDGEIYNDLTDDQTRGKYTTVYVD